MRSYLEIALLITIVIGARAATAQEQYDAGIFADAEGTTSTIAVTAFEQFEVYAVAFDLDGLVKAIEFSINGLLETGSFIVGNQINGPAPLNCGGCTHGLNYINGTGGCIDGSGAFWMVRVSVLPLDAIAADVSVCIGGTSPSTFNGRPGYTQCDDDIVPFGIAQNGQGRYPDGCLILNPTQEGPVPTASVRFGELKARF